MSRKRKTVAGPTAAALDEPQLPRKPDPKVVEAILKKKKAESLDRLARLRKLALRQGKTQFALDTEFLNSGLSATAKQAALRYGADWDMALGEPKRGLS